MLDFLQLLLGLAITAVVWMAIALLIFFLETNLLLFFIWLAVILAVARFYATA